MKLFGLTGGIACGKSTVEAALRDATPPAIVIDADAVVHAAQRPGSRAVRKIAKVWPHCVDHATMTLDRAKLSAAVFEDRAQLRRLTALIRTDILWEFLLTLLRTWWAAPRDAIVVLSLPLLYEHGFWVFVVSGVVAVACDEPTQVKRLMTRNGYSEAEARQRIAAQLPAAEKVRRANFVIRNDGNQPLAGVAAEARKAAAWMARQRTWHNGWNRLVAVAAALLLAGGAAGTWAVRRALAHT